MIYRRMLSHVSTHSRPKAAGANCRTAEHSGKVSTHSRPKAAGFHPHFHILLFTVSTHSRPKAAGTDAQIDLLDERFNTQPPEGGWKARLLVEDQTDVSTHSRPKAAGAYLYTNDKQFSFQHTAARRRLAASQASKAADLLFQHTAARRRLAMAFLSSSLLLSVSTHSRPKAAGALLLSFAPSVLCFNTQPPEGGWFNSCKAP